MGNLKAPGSDGLHALFFKSQWDSLKNHIVDFVHKVFWNPEHIITVNQTGISLIPKCLDPENPSQFRPISLCNVIYKVVTKLIAHRIKSILPHTISPCQSSFVQGRHTVDNVIIFQEAIHSMRNLKGKKGFMAIKLDLAKAYDRINWSFLLDSLSLIGIHSNLINITKHCISSPSMFINWNGEATSSFNPSCGIRQGRVTLTQSYLYSIPNYVMQAAVIPKGVCDEIEQVCRNFIWGSSESQRKCHLVSWEKICRPKDAGGLGFRSLRTLSEAYMLKLAWSIIATPDALWVRVLRAKYGLGALSMPQIPHIQKFSSLWKGIANSLRYLEDCICWILGNGSTTCFWKDPFIPNLGLPINHSSNPVPDWQLNLPAASFVVSNSWNWELVSDLLPQRCLDYLAGVKPPAPEDSADCPSWKFSSNGEFSIKSTYKHISDSINGIQPPDQFLISIWSWQGPPRIPAFIWKLSHGRLLTNSEKAYKRYDS